jgi:archaellum biogenesis protein FlaJ (TadC family)
LFIFFLGFIVSLLLILVLNLAINKFFILSVTIMLSLLLVVIVMYDIYEYSRKNKVEFNDSDKSEILKVFKYFLLILLIIHSVIKTFN